MPGTPPRRRQPLRRSLSALAVLLAVCLEACLGATGAQAQQRAAYAVPLLPMPTASLVRPPAMHVPVGPDSLAGAPRVLPLPPPWESDLIGHLDASQAAYSNWTEGGLNTLALTGKLIGKAEHTAQNWKQTYQTHLALGLLQQDTLSLRKATDQVRLSAALQYQGNGFFHTFNPTLAAGLRTQFIPGYNYKKNPFDEKRAVPVKVSDFLAPATFTQSVGLTYEPEPWIVQRLSLTGKQVVVTRKRLRPLYNLAHHSGVRYEAGVGSKTEVDRALMDNLHLQSTLNLFTAFGRTDAPPDMLWENHMTLHFNEWFSFNFEFSALYDGNVTEALQVREVVALGASVALL